ncbi:unnamed protein product [Linum trigynum]|uniref:Secreted protein n=1 Tax=Linum trigynum TaxID=586398 RepID=A0AAV2DTM3_9ROSI
MKLVFKTTRLGGCLGAITCWAWRKRGELVWEDDLGAQNAESSSKTPRRRLGVGNHDSHLLETPRGEQQPQRATGAVLHASDQPHCPRR